jgi:hypothetical protein
MKETYWLSYDLGIKGDYENLYTWLDSHAAKECGKGLAVFEFEGDEKALEDELKRSIQLKDGRLYLISLHHDKAKGSFLAGNRIRSPWEGYGSGPRKAVSEPDIATFKK